MTDNSFFSELRRRKVLQSAAIYGAVAWGVTEVLVTVVEQLFLPQWVATLAVIGFVVGFPVAMFLAWTFDITSEGIRRTDVTSRRGAASIAVSMVLLVAGTAGLFFLIRPALQDQETGSRAVSIVPNSVAVMPFANSGLDPNDSYLSEGLSDELRDQLGRMEGIRIAARSSSIAARDQGLDALAVSSKLGVANLVEGSLRRQGNRLRVSVQLIEGASGLAIWSETFERGPNELLSVQQAIAEQVVQQILPDAELIVSEPATRDATANELMLLARHYEQQVRDRQVVDVAKLREAVRLYREATEADPESALAHARLAGALIYLGDVDAAEAPVFRALALNPRLSEVHNTLGEFYWARGLPEARTAFARAVELNRNNADALGNYANAVILSFEIKNFENEGVAGLYRRALELDPLSISRHAALGDFLGKFGLVEELPAVIQTIEELFDSAESYRLIGHLYEMMGEIDKAIAWTLRARDREPENPDHVDQLAELYTIIGDAETALQLQPEPSVGLMFMMRRYSDLIDSAEFLMIEYPEDIQIRFLLAFAYNVEGQFESAIHVLGATGLLEAVTSDSARSVAEIEASFTLMNSLKGAKTPETTELALTLAEWNDQAGWWGDIYWISVHRACVLATLDRKEEALKQLVQVKGSRFLHWGPLVRDSYCYQQYQQEPDYQDVLRFLEQRQADQRERLPATLAEFGVEL